MLKKNKKKVALLFSISLVCGAIYGNYEFLKGHIFAETSEESRGESDQVDKSSKAILSEQNEEKFVDLDEKKIKPEDGWQSGYASDFLEKNGNKISWNNGKWWYTYNEKNWMRNNSLEINLIINDSMLSDVSENLNTGFFHENLGQSVYFKSTTGARLKRSFPYKTYQIDIIQELLDDGTIEVSYQVTNNNSFEQKIGISQYVDVLDHSLISITNDFKGFSAGSKDKLVILPDPETMRNWTISNVSNVKKFPQYSPQTVDGSGWESGKKYLDGVTHLNPPVNLKENQPIDTNDSVVSMKNPGTIVQPGETTIFKQKLKFGEMLPPKVTVDQKSGAMRTNESFDITGSISDRNNSNYRLYLELDDSDKTLIPLKDFKNIKLEEVQKYQATIEGKQFTAGDHVVSIIGIDEYGTRSEAEKIFFTIYSSNVENKKIGSNKTYNWEPGSNKDEFSNNGYKIEWTELGTWWYTYHNQSWLYRNYVDAALIVNGAFPSNTSDDAGKQEGFVSRFTSYTTYSIDKTTKSIKRSFPYNRPEGRYRITIIQQLLSNNAVEVTYQVTNLGLETQKIGISQYADVFVGSDSVQVTPINKFKGINLTYDSSNALVIIPDNETMPNWSAGEYSQTSKFRQYNVQNATGIGWETGKRYRAANGALYSQPQDLKENVAIDLGDSGVSMKNPGILVASNESVSFKQILKYGVLSPPNITLNQAAASMYQDETVTIDGTISDEDNMDYRVYLEMDDKAKTLIELAGFQGIPYNKVQKYQGTIEGKLFSPGVHNVSIIGIDEYGTRSKAKNLRLTITELNGEPKIQKIKLGEAISNDVSVLFKDIKGTNVTLKNPLSIDSSAIGFQWVEATLIDANKKEITKKIPVNIYNPSSTIFSDTDSIMLDAKDTSFELVEVRKSSEEGTLDELVRGKVNSKAWNMEDGEGIPVELITNGIKTIFGNYSATFKGTRLDSGASLKKESKLIVEGELKFKNVPQNLDYKKMKLSQKTPYVERVKSDWKIEIENTIGSNWDLFASAIPFRNQEKEKLSSTLVLKNSQTQDLIINDVSQKIATGNEIYPTIQWKETTGILLKVNSDAKVGSYQGEINWLLSDAP